MKDELRDGDVLQVGVWSCFTCKFSLLTLPLHQKYENTETGSFLEQNLDLEFSCFFALKTPRIKGSAVSQAQTPKDACAATWSSAVLWVMFFLTHLADFCSNIRQEYAIEVMISQSSAQAQPLHLWNGY